MFWLIFAQSTALIVGMMVAGAAISHFVSKKRRP